MTTEEIRAEIERRKKRAHDLKLPQAIWSLYRAHFSSINKLLHDDPELILPEVRESLVSADETNEFRFRGVLYRLTCRKGKRETDLYDRDTSVTPITLILAVDGSLSFEFEMRQTVTSGSDMPYFNERFGAITAFIEGQWTSDTLELKNAMGEHSRAIRRGRNAPKDAARLKQDMERFGL